MKQKGTNRRTLLNRIIYFWTGLTAFSIISAIIEFIYPPIRQFVGSKTLGEVHDFKPNTARVVQLGERPVIVISTEVSEIVAFRANCTHLGCVVQYREQQRDIFCACHGSVFSLEGKPISGPANRPLEKVPITKENNQVIITAV